MNADKNDSQSECCPHEWSKNGRLVNIMHEQITGIKILYTPQVNLGKALMELRKTHPKRYSQEGFAFEAGINRGCYGSIERGEVNVSLLTLEKICAPLETSMEKLFVRAGLLIDCEFKQSEGRR